MAWLETLHILAAVLWLGNFVVTGVWSARAFRQGDAGVRAFATREILFTDIVFTAVFGTVLTVSGIALAAREGVTVWSTFWTRTALEVLIAAGIVWLGFLLPVELRMRRLVAAGGDARRLARLFAAWNAVGWAVTVALCTVVYLMVARPA